MKNDTVTFLVGGMTCSHCENAIKKSVGSLKGVHDVEVDLKEKKVKVVYDSEQLNFKEVKDAIIAEGYEPDLFNAS